MISPMTWCAAEDTQSNTLELRSRDDDVEPEQGNLLSFTGDDGAG
jgi:hypothetical protein